jgi:hypothetical protein
VKKTVARPDLQFTTVDYDRLPVDLRVELIEGALVKMPSPTYASLEFRHS